MSIRMGRCPFGDGLTRVTISVTPAPTASTVPANSLRRTRGKARGKPNESPCRSAVSKVGHRRPGPVRAPRPGPVRAWGVRSLRGHRVSRRRKTRLQACTVPYFGSEGGRCREHGPPRDRMNCLASAAHARWHSVTIIEHQVHLRSTGLAPFSEQVPDQDEGRRSRLSRTTLDRMGRESAAKQTCVTGQVSA